MFEKVKELVRNNGHKVAVFGIMAAVIFTVGFAITGNVHDALGFAHRR